MKKNEKSVSMSESVEIEFKTLLTKENYEKICQFYQLDDKDFFIQKNIYYDTSDQALKKMGAGLRIRLYKENAEATLKTPLNHGLLETSDKLSLKEAETLLNENAFLTKGAIIEKLTTFKIAAKDLQILADLTEFSIKEGLLALDESWYSSQHDYELELEVQEANLGKKAFEELLQQMNIPYQPAKNKIQRAVAAHQKQS